MCRTIIVALSVTVAFGCAGSEDDSSLVDTRDGGAVSVDGGTERDAGSGPIDAGTRDGGPRDAGLVQVGFAEVEAIFDVRCAPCHEVGNRDRRIVVADYARIVNRPSAAAQMPYVTPSDPDNSWIYRKITSTHVAVCQDRGLDPRRCGGVMPTRDGTALTAAQVETVRSWIAGGAQR